MKGGKAREVELHVSLRALVDPRLSRLSRFLAHEGSDIHLSLGKSSRQIASWCLPL